MSRTPPNIATQIGRFFDIFYWTLSNFNLCMLLTLILKFEKTINDDDLPHQFNSEIKKILKWENFWLQLGKLLSFINSR